MRDDSNNWDTFRADDTVLKTFATTIRMLKRHQTIISGVRVQAEFAPCIDWPDIARGEGYSLSLRRDRVLLVGAEHTETDGWHATTGHAVSDATGAYEIFEIAGPGARDLLSRGGELQEPSKSVSRLLFGFGVFLYRHNASDCFRVHVARAHGQAMWQSLTGAASALT